MHKHRTDSVSLLVSLAVFALTAGGVLCAGESSQAELEDQFFQAVKEMRSAADSIAIAAKTEMVFVQRGGDSPGRREDAYELAYRGSQFQLKKKILDREGTAVEQISGRNETYFFVIERSSSGTQLVFLQEIGSPDGSGPGVDAFVTDLAVRYPVFGFQYVQMPIWDFVALPGFEIQEITELDESLVRIEHTVPPDYETPGHVLSDTYLICDRSQGWAIVELGQTAAYPAQEITQVTVHHLVDSSLMQGLCVATNKKNETTQLDDGYSSSTEFETEILDEPPVKEVFYLSHYGLPEPRFSRPWSRLSLGLFAAAAVCVLAWFISNRRSRTPSAAA